MSDVPIDIIQLLYYATDFLPDQLYFSIARHFAYYISSTPRQFDYRKCAWARQLGLPLPAASLIWRYFDTRDAIESNAMPMFRRLAPDVRLRTSSRARASDDATCSAYQYSTSAHYTDGRRFYYGVIASPSMRLSDAWWLLAWSDAIIAQHRELCSDFTSQRLALPSCLRQLRSRSRWFCATILPMFHHCSAPRSLIIAVSTLWWQKMHLWWLITTHLFDDYATRFAVRMLLRSPSKPAAARATGQHERR